MPFFIRNKKSGAGLPARTKGNRKRNASSFASEKNKRKKRFNGGLEEEIHSDEFEDDDEEEINLIDADDDDGGGQKKKRKKVDASESDSDTEDENETAQEKKIRLAKQYLEQLQQSEIGADGDDDDDDGGDQVHRSNLMISAHLKESVLEKMGKLHRTVADRYRLGTSDVRILKNGHRKTVTAVVISHQNDSNFVITGGKDCNLVKWNAQTGKRLITIFGNHRENPETYTKGHTAVINALALSTDDKFLASGCHGRVIHIWSPGDMTRLHTFRGHRGAIRGLAFRRSFHQLFSCSEDRMVKVWNLDEMTYVESLLGHHDAITAVDSFVRERCLTAGGRDGTIRLWKVPEESNLIFLTGGTATIDGVQFINESHFLSASDDGTISLWTITKKKPLFSVRNAHGPDHWITAIVSLRNTDLFASGSHNGTITFWRIRPQFKGFDRLFDYPVTGFVNAMAFSADGHHLVAAIGQEHRLGRWWHQRDARNTVHIVPLMMDALD